MQKSKFSKKDQEFLLSLARKSIEETLLNKPLKTDENSLSSSLKEKQSCFVTLTIEKGLRGCIGHILPIQELYLDVIDNAKAAAFDDPRFYPLEKNDLSRIKIEISVLDIPKKFEYKNPSELIEFLNKNHSGVILSKGQRKATFLPSVWEELSAPESFLGYLCAKAGLPQDEWKHGVEIEIYGAEKFSE